MGGLEEKFVYWRIYGWTRGKMGEPEERLVDWRIDGCMEWRRDGWTGG